MPPAVIHPVQDEPSAAKKPDCTLATIEAAAPTWHDGKTCSEQLAPRCEHGDGDACLGAATILINGSGGAPRDPEGARTLATSACARGSAAGCMITAAMHEHGIGVPADPAAATAFIAKACDLGDARACQAKAARAPKGPAFIPGADLTVGSIAADGLELRDLMCDVTGGMPMLGALVIAGTLAKQKRALDKCAPAGQAFAVTWTFTAGKARDITASGGSNTANACVTKAVARTAATLDGRCGAIVLVGKTAGAMASLEAVRTGTVNAK